MLVKKKVSLSSGSADSPAPEGVSTASSEETLELFFNSGIIYQEISLPPELPEVIAGYKLLEEPAEGAVPRIRRASGAEDPDVELSAIEQLGELANRWLPVPYPTSCATAIQVFLAPTGRGGLRALMAIDTLAAPGTKGRHFDPEVDAGRPYGPMGREDIPGFWELAVVRTFVRQLKKAGVDKAVFKLSALMELLSPFLPRVRLSQVADHPNVDVSLVLDLGNSRSTAVVVEARDKGVMAIPLQIRSSSNPLDVSDEPFDSRITFIPSPFDPEATDVGVGDSFVVPSIARLGREALDRALETPHRYLCTLSGPKRYLWDDAATDDRWHYAVKIGSDASADYQPVFGRMLKFIDEASGGLALRDDGPSTPVDPRYAPRTMMLFALAEILLQALSQINSVGYRKYQGKEANPRVLKHVVLTHPSGMSAEEKAVYEKLIQNAVTLVCYMSNIELDRRPNVNSSGEFEKFLFADEALAAQMVYLYEEVAHTFSGNMEDMVKLYGRGGTVRVASVDIGGGTSDVMIAEYSDRMEGTGTSLAIKQLFQDGVSIAGDEVCRAILEDVVFSQLLQQIESHTMRAGLIHLFAEADAGHGAAWRTLKAKLVPYFWLPLARCYWAVAEGFEIPDHSSDKHYSADDIFELFNMTNWSPSVVAEADRFLESIVSGFPGLRNLFFRFDRQEVERTVDSVLREPLRRYADIIAQFDVDILVLAGRTSALGCIEDIFIEEMPVSPPRIKTMAQYRVGEWYPAKWRENGVIVDPKSTVTAGATILHLAHRNQLAGFILDEVIPHDQKPIYGLYQDAEPHLSRQSELFRDGPVSKPMFYTHGMVIGFRNVDSQEMDASPLFEVSPSSPAVATALLSDRVTLVFELAKSGEIFIKEVQSQKDMFDFSPDAFRLKLKTVTTDRYWLDTGVFKNISRYL